MLDRRLMSVAALGLSASVALTGCSGKDVADKAKQHASALATNSQAQALKSKAATAAKSKLSDITGSASATGSMGASGSAAAGSAGATVDLGKFAGNRKAKVVGAFYTKRRQGKPGPFLVTVTGVKGGQVSVCVGPKGKRSQTVVVAKGKVKGVRKGTATCS
ncbi:hypothetical protein GCM10028801_40440 [Nocardioides maradonensis]